MSVKVAGFGGCPGDSAPASPCGPRRSAAQLGRQVAESPTMRKASCSCGQLTVNVVGDPVRVSVCHCLACQQRTGSVFGAQARFPTAALTIIGESREYVRVGDSGGHTHFNFCPTCGSTVFYTTAGSPEHTAIPVGAFGDPTFPAPMRSVADVPGSGVREGD